MGTDTFKVHDIPFYYTYTLVNFYYAFTLVNGQRHIQDTWHPLQLSKP